MQAGFAININIALALDLETSRPLDPLYTSISYLRYKCVMCTRWDPPPPGEAYHTVVVPTTRPALVAAKHYRNKARLQHRHARPLSRPSHLLTAELSAIVSRAKAAFCVTAV